MKTSKTGYLKNSPDVNKSQNIIQGGDITMKGVDFKVLGTDDRGYTKIMQPGYDYKFPGAKYVTETPIKKTNMESNKQEKKNLLKDNPIASHGSWISKHSIAAGSPVHMGGSGKSPLYEDKKSGNLPKQVDENPTSRLYKEGAVIKERATGNVVVGGFTDDTGKYVPRTAAQRRPIKDTRLKEERKKDFLAKQKAHREKKAGE
jgi:hypothetical protein